MANWAPHCCQRPRVRSVFRAERPTAEPRNGIDTTLLDEIQIITAWMKQRTREGSYLRLDERAPPQTTAELVDEWILGQLVDQTQQLAA